MSERRERVVHVQRGQRVRIDAGRGVQLLLERDTSGAVELWNLVTLNQLKLEKSGALLRQWAPKEAQKP